MKMNVFDFNDAPVRVVLSENGEPWFVASDVCRALDIGNTSMAVQGLDDDEAGISSNDTRSQTQDDLDEIVAHYVFAGGVAGVCLGSDSPEIKLRRIAVLLEQLAAKEGGQE